MISWLSDRAEYESGNLEVIQPTTNTSQAPGKSPPLCEEKEINSTQTVLDSGVT